MSDVKVRGGTNTADHKERPIRRLSGSRVGMKDAVPEKQVATALCPSCGRVVQGRQLRKVSWKGRKGPESEWACYSCVYNVFPPGHPLFEQVQKWRAARGKSIVQATPERVARYKGPGRVEDAKVAVEASSTLMKANDERMLASAMDEWKSGLIARSLMGSPCGGPGCPNVIHGPIIAIRPESQKRRAVWGYCSQKCLDDFWMFLTKGLRHKPVLIPKFSQGGQVVALLRRDTGQWIKPGDVGEVEFCPRCDKLLPDACDCTQAELNAFHKAARRGSGGGAVLLSPHLESESAEASAAAKPVVLPGAIGNANGNGAQGEPATLQSPVPSSGASSHETPVVNPEASEIQKLAAGESKKLEKKLGEEASSEMEGFE